MTSALLSVAQYYTSAGYLIPSVSNTMADEKSAAYWVHDIPTPVASKVNVRRPLGRRVLNIVKRFTLLSLILFTLFIWSGGKFNRFTGGEEDLWIVDAFVRHSHDNHGKGGPLRGEAAEKLYL